ncbi:CG6912 [Drosophila busckii]|uniref:CG6912 n=1 Tax=Drosophila busckii TaxID=30019 RepID=A0A0M5JC45_DROBS|nr:uncharacterized protein LOC108602391 [Drosophila busckii]ALC45868.1 CG6912 [Drosophila busckii]
MCKSLSVIGTLLIVGTICYDVVQGYQNAAGEWSACPEGYEHLDGQCQPILKCDEDYFLHTDGKCYRKVPEPCPYDSTTEQSPTTTTTTATPSSSTIEPAAVEPEVEPPPNVQPTPDEQVRCPPNSIFLQEKCRKIVCTQGEYHAGRCLLPACPAGTVWRNKQCLPPGFVTTILEIDNVIDNQFENQASTENIQHVEYITASPYDPATDPSMLAQDKYTTTTQSQADNLMSTTTEVYAGLSPSSGCCTVKSPRLCRPYEPNWVCINRSLKLCDSKVCTRPFIYLKPPEIVQLSNPPMLVMPPITPAMSTPPFEFPESDFLDCSGCAQGISRNCSSGCYSYFCPGDVCDFMKSEDFCALYPGGLGCNIHDGCIWNWCTRR